MILYDLVLSAIETIRGAKLRSLLTTIGITIGVFSIILLMALGDATRSYVGRTFASLGDNVLQVRPGKRDTQGAAPISVSGVGHALSLGDARAIEGRLVGADGVSGVVEGAAQVRWSALRRDVSLFGVGTQFARVRHMEVESGRFFSQDEDNGRRKVVVIGHLIQEELFGDTNPLGKLLRVNDSEFRVVGVLEPKGSLLGTDLDDLVLIPAASALDLFDLNALSAILVRPRSGTNLDDLRDAVEDLLKRRHNQQVDFSIVSQDELLATINATMAALTAVLAAIASIALVVGGIGIANIMLATVHERTREIGLRRALGATRAVVMLQFLVESAALSWIGGYAGVFLGTVVIGVASVVKTDFPIELSPWIGATALGFSALVGILAGVVPARRAAALDPLEALRYE